MRLCWSRKSGRVVLALYGQYARIYVVRPLVNYSPAGRGSFPWFFTTPYVTLEEWHTLQQQVPDAALNCRHYLALIHRFRLKPDTIVISTVIVRHCTFQRGYAQY